jgi:hypothetical protein
MLIQVLREEQKTLPSIGYPTPFAPPAHHPHLPLRQGRLLTDVLQRQLPPLRPRAPLADAGEQRAAAAGQRLESCQLRHGEPTDWGATWCRWSDPWEITGN